MATARRAPLSGNAASFRVALGTPASGSRRLCGIRLEKVRCVFFLWFVYRARQFVSVRLAVPRATARLSVYPQMGPVTSYHGLKICCRSSPALAKASLTMEVREDCGFRLSRPQILASR
jgi:hypothetical protein